MECAVDSTLSGFSLVHESENTHPTIQSPILKDKGRRSHTPPHKPTDAPRTSPTFLLNSLSATGSCFSACT
jgi:hypothetical protein